ncbi:uncharacterized protein ANIA_11571 [Aspergillus nidulans FGSC A4]|uniref:Uncharacterized protein n=1 Tax=Emericella nidulans (strain FGSC A4 / ATCC 38163 / CBS 112.46 / NRRL 194 / M139) TaxID=227321 RepID=C8VDJ9_EMENI|nr:hypothetical protein [Aspergillus nidulans FGSC A4]CBF79997.1 TPA: hypothetical protein ANIA_11571 [Aspergillus nidulans FGSC A4]
MSYWRQPTIGSHLSGFTRGADPAIVQLLLENGADPNIKKPRSTVCPKGSAISIWVLQRHDQATKVMTA